MPVFEIDDSNVMIKLVIRRNVVDGAAVADDGGANGASSNNTASEKQQSTSKELSIVADKPAAKFVAHPANKIASHKSTRCNIIDPRSIMDQLMNKIENTHHRHNNNNKEYSKQNCLWNERFNELLAYKRIHGNFSVPRDYNGSRSLEMWVSINTVLDSFASY